MGNYRGLENLEVWKRSMDFAVTICKELLPILPPDEKYALVSQLRRAVQSIPANIAEGYGRYYYQEGIRYCYIARGSADEVNTQITMAFRLNYLPQERYQTYISELNEIRMMLNGYISYLKRSKRGEKEPGNIHVMESRFESNTIATSGLPKEDES